MATVISSSPFCLIPKELYDEKNIHDYWNALYPDNVNENIGTDDIESSYLLYPKPNNVDARYELSVSYNRIKRKLQNHANIVYICTFENELKLLVIKDNNLVYIGCLHFDTKEDVLYHLANVSQHYYENNLQVIFLYQQLTASILRLLKKYFDIKKFRDYE